MELAVILAAGLRDWIGKLQSLRLYFSSGTDFMTHLFLLRSPETPNPVPLPSTDFGVIIAILLLNAFVGWYQEKQAGDIVQQLKAGIALKATVVRNGAEEEIEARELVVGDVVILEEGRTIPADAKVGG